MSDVRIILQKGGSCQPMRHATRGALWGLFLGSMASVAGAQEAGQGILGDVTALAPHRAVYEISLGEPSMRSAKPAALASVAGRLVYEFKGNACEGYSTTQRLVTTAQRTESDAAIEDVQLAGFEDPSGNSYQFAARQLLGRSLLKTMRGVAERDGAQIVLAMKSPREARVILPGDVLFPSAWFQTVIEAAKRGEPIISVDLFDGAEAAGAYFHTTVSIGKPHTGPTNEEALRPLSSLIRWPIRVAYFPADGDVQSMAPSYEVSSVLFENGVNGSLTFYFSDYSLKARLTSMELLAETGCN